MSAHRTNEAFTQSACFFITARANAFPTHHSMSNTHTMPRCHDVKAENRIQHTLLATAGTVARGTPGKYAQKESGACRRSMGSLMMVDADAFTQVFVAAVHVRIQAAPTATQVHVETSAPRSLGGLSCAQASMNCSCAWNTSYDKVARLHIQTCQHMLACSGAARLMADPHSFRACWHALHNVHLVSTQFVAAVEWRHYIL
jgi:hypothetical protein